MYISVASVAFASDLLPKMGVGIGGDYPLSAVLTAEFSSTHIRGRLMTAVFANQGWGQLGKFPRLEDFFPRTVKLNSNFHSRRYHCYHRCRCLQARFVKRRPYRS